MDLIIWYPNFVGLLLWLYIPRREKRTAPASWFQAIFPIMHIYIHKVYVYIRNKMLNMGELYTSILMNNWRINVPEPSTVPWYLYIWNLFGTFEGPGRFYQSFLPFFSPQRKIRPATVAVRRCAAELLVAAVEASTRCVFLRHAEKLGCKVVSETWHRLGENPMGPIGGGKLNGMCFRNVRIFTYIYWSMRSRGYWDMAYLREIYCNQPQYLPLVTDGYLVNHLWVGI